MPWPLPLTASSTRRLLGVELDDQFLVDGHRHVGARRQRLHDAREGLRLDLEPLGHATTLGELEGLLDPGDLPAALAHRYLVARPHGERGDVDFSAVDPEVPVSHQLPGLGPGGGEPEPVDDVVQPPLEQLQERLARHAADAVGLLEVPSELILEDPVDAPELLLLAQLDRVLGELRTRLSVLAGWIVAALDGALVGVAALSL